MQSTSEDWKALVSGGAFQVDTKAEIGEEEYSSISAPVIERGLMQGGFSVGNVCSASLRIDILTDDEIPRSSAITIKMRLTDGTTTSEWLPAGTFYISKRRRDPVTGLLSIEAYDALLKANAAYSQSGSYPKSMSDVVDEIAAALGVDVDERTDIQTGSGWTVPLPDAEVSMHDILAGIGAAHGGSWIITPENKLRMVLLGENYDTVSIIGITGSIETKREMTITGLRVAYTDGNMIYGTTDGAVLDIDGLYVSDDSMDWLTARLIGLTYQAYNLTGAYYDPAAELGDTLISRSDIQSAILTERVAFNVAWRAEIGAPEVGEVEDEYPYIGQTAQTARQLRRLNEIIADRATVEELEAVIARINNLSVDDIRAGVIHSADYQTGAAALVYPDSGTYPGTDVYPSAGETVTKGFAIDFSSGQIYGAFYSEQIASLDARVTALENR